MSDNRIDARPISIGQILGDYSGPTARSIALDPTFAKGGKLQAAAVSSGFPVLLGRGECATFEFDRLSIGLPIVEVEAPAGATVVLRAGETLVDGVTHDPVRQWAHLRRCRGGREVIEPFDGIGLRFLTVAAEDPITILRVGLRERRYPYKIEGSFHCDDAQIERIWELGLRTLEVCSTDAFLDCPTREQRAWVGDSYVHAMLRAVVSSDGRLADHVLRLGARSRRRDGLLGMIAAGDFTDAPLTIPDFSLHWIRTLARSFEHTGDVRLAAELFPVTEGILDWFGRFVSDQVLGPVPGWTFLDWYPIEGDTPNATLQGLLIMTLDDHAKLAAALGRPLVATQSRLQANSLRSGFRHFFDSHHPRILDDPTRRIASQHAVATAVLAGAVDRAIGSQLLDEAVDPSRVRFGVRNPGSPRGWALAPDFEVDRHILGAQPFFCHFLHQAMTRIGRLDLLVQSIRRWAVFDRPGEGTLGEYWPETHDQGSHAHAWSGTCTYDLSTHVLGIQSGEPGFSTLRVRPWFGPLNSLRGAVPTPKGLVSLELERQRNSVRGTVRLPRDVSGDLAFAEWPGFGTIDLFGGVNHVEL
jgi:hypothetical protein